MSQVADKLLQIAFRITGSRRVSEIISERRVERKWRETVAKHIAAGGVVGSYRSNAGTQEFLL